MAPSRSVAAYFTPSTMPKPNPCLNRIASVALVAVLAACGGKAPETPLLSGRFLDGPVQGLGYRTASHSGTTDANGGFRYRAGESVTFSIGGMDLPPVTPGAVVTPLDVMKTSSLDDPKVVKLLLLLQSLDDNSNLGDGIQIPQAAQALSSTAGRALAQALQDETVTAFRTTLGANSLLAGKSLASPREAVVHFAKTLMQETPSRSFTTSEVVVTQAGVVKEDGSATAPGWERPAVIRFEGLNLDAAGLVPQASGACSAVSLVGQATSTRVEFTCTPASVGSLTVALQQQGQVVATHSVAVEEPRVLLSTSLGDLTLELSASRAPITTRNFLRYVDAGYYTSTVFHRVINDFMVQGGGCIVAQTAVLNGGCVSGSSTVRLKGNTFPAIDLERTSTTGLSNVAGTVAMARTDVEKSATSQFFINVVDRNSSFLDADTNPDNLAGYAVFGRVVEGATSTLQSIRNVTVQGTLPVNPPVILSATRVR